MAVDCDIARDLVTVDEAYDRANASDGVSRYGAYLRSRAHLFDDDGGLPLDAVAFTILAWQIANSPVMSPGYVRRRPDITAVICRHGEEPGLLVADIELRLPWPSGLRMSQPLARRQGWARTRPWADEPPAYIEPADDRPALLPTAHLWVPIPEASLPAPLGHTGPGMVDVNDAKRAVVAVCRHLNTIAGPAVAAVQESCGGHDERLREGLPGLQGRGLGLAARNRARRRGAGARGLVPALLRPVGGGCSRLAGGSSLVGAAAAMQVLRRGDEPARRRGQAGAQDLRGCRRDPGRWPGVGGCAVREPARTSCLPRVWLIGLGAMALGWLMQRMPAETPGRVYWPWFALGGLAVVLAVVAFWWHRHIGSSGRINRWSARSRRNDGVASSWTILRVASRLAMRRKATVLRPSLARLGVLGRLRVRTREIATPVARVGVLRIWSPVEDVTLRIGGPRTGKTGELAGRILDAPGAVIATSTGTELIELTGPRRSRRGPVHVFNPSGVGGLPSTITFDPLSGCERPTRATTRAADLLAGVSTPGVQGGDREFWAGQARRVLASLMHAAALGDATMRDVLAWVADPDTAAPEVRRFLRRSPEPAYESDALQFLGTNDRTRSSICATIMPALGWLTDSVAAAAASKGEFDVAELLERHGTVYMLGAEDAQVAPLVTALTGHVAREARRIAGAQPGGRLDPPLTLALDEAALICPVPLDNWTADMGGRGVTIHIAVQSRAQLRQRWGDTGAAAILNNAATVLIYGGTRDPEDLAAYSTLTGERYEEVPTWDDHGALTAVSTRRVPVLSAAQIAQLPARHVVIIRRGMPPAVGKVTMAWRRRDVRRTRRAMLWADRFERWAAARDRATETAAALLEVAAARLLSLLQRLDRSHAERAIGSGPADPTEPDRRGF